MKCGECKYWEANLCYRYPESVARIADGWCGEWQPKLEEYRTVKASEIATPEEIPRVTSVSDWQPIETAPKDTPVLAYCKRWHDQVDIAIYSDYWYANGGRLAVEYYPTHWMPLPEPPE